MNFVNRFVALVVLAGLIQGCSRPGNSSVEVPEPDFFYSFDAEDAKIVGLKVTDSADTAATETSPGTYQFATNYVPQPPIRFASQNFIEGGETFQDLDGDGVKSAADIDYNTGFDLNFIGFLDNADARTVFANPLTALIPATGIPSDGIAGLPSQVFDIAFTSGVAGASDSPIAIGDETIPASQLIGRSVVMITAVQEAIVSAEGNTEDAQTTAISFVTELFEEGLDQGLDDPAGFGQAATNAITASVNQENLALIEQVATSVGDMVSDTNAEDISFFESVVVIVQETVTPDSTVESTAQVLTPEQLQATDNGVELEIDLAEEIAEAGGLATFLSNLNIVPIHIGDNGASLVDDGITGFALTLDTATQNIVLNAAGSFIDQQSLQYFFDDDLYGVRVSDTQAVLASLNVNETNLLNQEFAGISPARLIALCTRETVDETAGVCGQENANLEFYALATEAEICSSSFESERNEVLLAQINSLNSKQITCN